MVNENPDLPQDYLTTNLNCWTCAILPKVANDKVNMNVNIILQLLLFLSGGALNDQ